MSEAMERAREQVGRAAHEAWKRWRIEGGYPDHVFAGVWAPDNARYFRESFGCRLCSQSKDRHHEDMVAWERMEPHKRTKYIVQGMAGYEARQGEVSGLRVDVRTLSTKLEQRSAWKARVKELLHGAAVESHEIEQVLGRALGYPWFKDDSSNFPSATEADGVFVGPHTALTLADEAAAKIATLEAERERVGRVREAAQAFFDAEKEWRETGQPDWVVSWQRARFSEAKSALRDALATDPARGATNAVDVDNPDYMPELGEVVTSEIRESTGFWLTAEEAEIIDQAFRYATSDGWMRYTVKAQDVHDKIRKLRDATRAEGAGDGG